MTTPLKMCVTDWETLYSGLFAKFVLVCMLITPISNYETGKLHLNWNYRKTEDWILCHKHVAYSIWHSSVVRKSWVAYSLGMYLEAEWLKDSTYSRLKTSEILNLHFIAAPVWVACRSEEYFFVLLVGGSRERQEDISSWEKHSLKRVLLRNILLRIYGCHFCLFSIEVLMEFLSLSILENETLLKVAAVWERQFCRMDSTKALMFEMQKRVDVIPFPPSSQLEWYMSYFISGRVG